MPAFPPNWENLERSLQTDVETNIVGLLASVAALNAVTSLTNAEINANPAPVIKDLARELKTVTRQMARLARLSVAAFGSADTGT